ncbi:AMP-binding protein [Arthrobacter tumbae]|uniref:AMP-binding protein n=1 Tax=Arthrobacter tumbae TaxID=163874 RepID=UPI0027DBEF39|nr:AMP-binding protein [Arthrobacter tumbae]MBM7780435.1 acyl-CoA synthetase (AMP-forming)/AMP-acid ligase II [Arthrobacter tumbae]
MSLTTPILPLKSATRSVGFAAELARFADSPAIITDGGTLSYSQLADRVEAVVDRLGPDRRLVLLAATNDVDSLVAYLAALSAGHPVVLVPGDKPAAVDSIQSAFDPDVIVAAGDGNGTPRIQEIRALTSHELHPDLALLLSTSGSTGSPKLVRLSHQNLESNAAAIAEYLRIGPADRAVTTLPMSYCYGLSVLNSHLLTGASLVLTDLSVVDPCFWELFRRTDASAFAAVPYTFELLERVGFPDMDLPKLRYLTQAGGRLAPDLVRRYADLGNDRGWELFVMYGQTEATARMAYLPPALAAENPSRIGVPVPGGNFRVDPVDGLDDGELVYTGPNVMLGYAETPEDLAAGRTVNELRTGDLARRHPDGLYEVVGRRSRFIKVAGLRIDLGCVEQILAGLGVRAACAGTDDRLVVALEGDHEPGLLRKVLARDLGIPRGALAMYAVEQLPRLSNGKPDYQSVLALAEPAPEPRGPSVTRKEGPRDVRAILAEQLEVATVDDHSTFVSLGGDSLSYVATSVRLERALGTLPADWHVRSVAELEKVAEPEKLGSPIRRRRFFAPVETSIVLRAVAIILIISTHIGLFRWEGTAHVLLAAAGFNFARFQLEGERWHRLRRQLTSIARIVVPSVALIFLGYLITDHYSVANIFLLNALVGPQEVTPEWHFWFVEVLTYLLVGAVTLLAVPPVARLERRSPFGFPLGLAAVGLLTRFNVVDLEVPNTAPALWLFALGWAVARARSTAHRFLITAVALLCIPGFFYGDLPREMTLLTGMLLLVWVPRLPVPTVLQQLTVVLASASLYIYLTHWLVFPHLETLHPSVGVAASLIAGVLYWALVMRVPGLFRRKTPALTRSRRRLLR